MILRNYDYDIEHLPGRNNPADGLSRIDKTKPNSTDSVDLDVYAMDIIEYSDIINYITTMNYPVGATEKVRERLRNKSKQYRVINGKLHRIVKNKIKEVLHEHNAKEIINNIHQEGHEGVENTWKRVSNLYTGRGLFKDVVDIVKCCHTCQLYQGDHRD
ncbi:Transposon Tf2-8 polyprotein [Zancudomyces culisetae]|uniref:Transposon Tf2-8 polyprotein n=1 Tax=Zancudomyces culisetae TaxID=1213189 RepID=A0A1R1PLQ8_ZANCU|nr:Transposon Tf2-8 polyprotein [Zancudomyces culisetae]|eukprot:OMH81908.1 Transposon Tf2-8 polyprotein [Zancudomyces culisetae]